MPAFLDHLHEHALPAKDVLKEYDNIYQVHTKEGADYFLILENGEVNWAFESAEPPMAIVTASEQMVLDVINGKVSPMRALLFGGVHVTGDVKPLLRLAKLV